MKNRVIYIILLFLGLNNVLCLSQWGDILPNDSLSFYVVLNCVPTFEGEELGVEDSITLSPMSDSDEEVVNNYFSDSILIFQFPIESFPDFEISNDSLSFSVFSQSNGCISTKVNYVIDHSDKDSWYTVISQFNVSNHTFTYPNDVFCRSSSPILPITDLPDNELSFYTEPEGLSIGNSGEIITAESIIGTYSVALESAYCLLKDTFVFEVIEAPSLGLEDTMNICSSEGLTELSNGFPEFYFLPVGVTDTGLFSSFESGDYHVYNFDDFCPSTDTVYIDIQEELGFSYEITYTCESAIIEIVPESDEVSIMAFDEETIEPIVIYEDQEVTLALSNDYCVSEETLYVELKKLTFTAAEFMVQDATCWEDGRLDIRNSLVENDFGNLSYRLKNTLDESIIEDIDNVPEGIWKVQAIDERVNEKCIANLDGQEPVIVLQECLEDYPVFSPNSLHDDSQYFIPHVGKTNIYDRDGRLIVELETPAYWNGNDDAGNPMPMGNYLMVTDDDKKVNITIVR